MSDDATAVAAGTPGVLVVGDSPPVAAAAAALESALGADSVWLEPSTDGARDRLDSDDVRCVVCEFDSSAGGSVFDEIREGAKAVPIVAVADTDAQTAAIEAGATDVVDPATPSPVAVTRVGNAVRGTRLDEREPDRNYRRLLEYADVPLVVVTADGTITYATPAVDRLGWTPDDLVRSALPGLVHPDDRDRVREVVSGVRDRPVGSTETVTCRLHADDGAWTVVELTAVDRLEDPDIEGVITTITVAPEVGDETLEAALEHVGDPLLVLGERWELVHWTDAAGRLLGEEPDPGTILWSVLPDDVREPFADRLREAAATGDPVAFETSHPAFDAPLEVTAYPDDGGMAVVARERSDGDRSRTDAETPVRTDANRLALLEDTIDGVVDGVAVLDGTTVELANASFRELADDDVLIGRGVDDLFDADLAARIRERLESPVFRWMEPVSGDLAVGDGRAVDVFITPLDGDARAVCTVRDRRRSGATLRSSVLGAVCDLRRADTPVEIRRTVADAVLGGADAEFAAWYRVDDGVLEPAAVATTGSDGRLDLPAVAVDRTEIEPLLDAGEAIVSDGSTLEPLLERSGVRAERVFVLPVDDENLVLATTARPLGFASLEVDAVEPLADAASVALEALERRRRLRTVGRERDVYEALEADSERLRADVCAILAAETRDDLEQRVCEAVRELTPVETTGSIGLVWIGRHDVGAETLTPSTWVGDGGEFLDSLSMPVDPDPVSVGRESPPNVPAEEPSDVAGENPSDTTAAEPSDATAVIDLESESNRRTGDGEPWLEEPLEYGYRSALLTPIEYGEFRYGTLTAYGDRPGLFDDRVRNRCRHLATVTGHATAALERKRALLSESGVELELVVGDEDDPLLATAHHLETEIVVRTVVPRSSGGSTIYCTTALDDADADSLAGVDSIRRIGTDSGVELVVREETIAERIAEHGGALRSIEPADDRTRLVVELPNTIAVRGFVRMLERSYRGVKLVARRERPGSDARSRSFDAELRDRLSDRQLRTLETAYYSGFFEWPRESTGEEVARLLGVSQPTFSRHSRIAQQKLFELLFDERGDGE
ncbi:bacterio-opsin activator domain-containing protein [Natrialba sp. INN-245]|uniref:bacterio-opsin activator domain-containing protein n=1 Tax=Natrialba sp. INN-245 TaxID=2690967 RepID=UPI0013137629|nr:PAS domain-containing protein [Natrialba sp. INN-245]